MNFSFRSIGILRYSPKLLGDELNSKKWWLIMDCPPSIGEYYRSLYKMKTHGCDLLQRPGWKEHVTVVADEEPADAFKSKWHLLDGCHVPFYYGHYVDNNKDYFWLPVICPALYKIRESLGLPRDPFYPFHLTIGNNKYV